MTKYKVTTAAFGSFTKKTCLPAGRHKEHNGMQVYFVLVVSFVVIFVTLD